MTTITIYVRPMLEYGETSPSIDHVSLVCQGVSYQPAEAGEINDMYKYTFEVMTEPDETPALPIWVVDGMNVGEKLG